MARQKIEVNKTIRGNGILDSENMTILIGDEIIALKEKLDMFNGENVKFSFALVETIAEE